MFRIEGGKFFGEDANTGRPGTVVTPEWLNSVQEEIANVIEKSNVKLDQGNPSQLYEAISSIFRPISEKIDALEKSLKYSRLDLRGSRIKYATTYYDFVAKTVKKNEVDNVPDTPFSSCNISILRNAYEAIILCRQSFILGFEANFPEVGYVLGSGNTTTTVFTFKITGSLPEPLENEPPIQPFVLSSESARIAIDYYQTYSSITTSTSTTLMPVTAIADSTLRLEVFANGTFTLLLNCRNPFSKQIKFPVTENNGSERMQGFRFENRIMLPNAMKNRDFLPDIFSADDVPSE